ncbi:hypothetical protein ACWEPN_10325 [Nonomuraea wenchangensis]
MTPQVGGWRHAAVGGRAKNRMQESIAATAAKRALRSARTVQRHLRARDERAPKGGGCA